MRLLLILFQRLSRACILKFNGAYTASDLIIRTTEKEGATDTEILETIKERSAGYVKVLEYQTGFESSGKKIYMFIKQMDDEN